MTQNELYTDRVTAVRQKLTTWGVDGLLITAAANRRWISGFTGSAGQILITPEQALLATDFRYWEQATAQAPHFTLFKHQRRAEDTAAFLAASGATKLGLEAAHTTLLESAILQAAQPDWQWVPLPETLESFRRIKHPTELAAIRAAATITDHTMSQVNQLARPGQMETELAWELEKVMREAGAEATAFDIIVASGPNSALPHHKPGNRQLQPGDALIVDLGAQVAGYKSDLTRSFYLGSHPTAEFWQIYNLVLTAQTAVFTHTRPHMTGQTIDSLARDIINAAGHQAHFGHGLGHGVGLEIHESPRFAQTADQEIITPDMVITVEPGVYIPDWGGVRIEDLALVNATGLESISQCPKNPIISENPA